LGTIKFLNVNISEARGSSKTNKLRKRASETLGNVRFKDPLFSDLLLFPFIYEAINEGGWRHSATRDSMKRVDCDLEGLPFMILITAPVGVEAASHIFASLAIGAAPPVTRKRRRGR
jgi:hypothetical protein